MRLAAGMAVLMGVIGFLPPQPAGSAPTYGYRVVHTYPHDRDAFTQGLIVRDGVFYEGTGLAGRSTLRKVKIDTGEVLQTKAIPSQYFGEGITDWKGSLLQLTWQSEVGFVYDMKSFDQTRTLLG
jgi:glutaminyl-peptide cyclotransferase